MQAQGYSLSALRAGIYEEPVSGQKIIEHLGELTGIFTLSNK